MPIRYRVNEKRKLITVIVEGKITAEDAAAGIREHGTNPTDSHFARLVLISDRAATLSTSEINDLAQVVNDLSTPDSNRCAIVSFTDVHFGQSRMYLSNRNKSPETLKVFRDLKEALTWLGVDSNRAVMEFEMAIALS